eukprot:SM000059S18653  [mRNA]  locus=s59:99109:100450:- [translate_table: standard]
MVIHGLFGTGRNWRTPARNLAAAAVEMAPPGSPGWRLVLVDLRNHGKSARLPGFKPPHTVQAAAQDLCRLAEQVKGWRGPEVIIGHSLGGKVALEYSRASAKPPNGFKLAPPQQVWVLDSVPGQVEQETADGDVERVVSMLKSFPPVIPSRRWLLQQMAKLGFSEGLAEWLASSLQRQGHAHAGSKAEAMEFMFDVEGATDMFNSYK